MSAVLGMRRHAPLFRNMVRREVRQRYKGSALGLVWTLISPAIAVAVYSLVFKFLLRLDIPHYAVFLLTGLATWTFFMGGAQQAAFSLVANANLVKKVRFPREIIPLSSMAGNAVTAGAMFLVALPLCLAFTAGSRLTVFALPGMLILLAGLTAGFGLLVSALNVYFRDVEHILAAINLPWYFLTPIMYSFATLPALADGSHAWVVNLLHYGNPVSPFVIAIQDCLFWGQWPAWQDVVYSLVASVVVLASGLTVFRRLEREMAVEL